MSGLPPPPPLPDADLAATDVKAVGFVDNGVTLSDRDEDSINLQKEIYDTSAIDPVLAKKMALTNNALDQIGMTPWQWKLFCLNGFGYAVDSVINLHRVVQKQVLLTIAFHSCSLSVSRSLSLR